MGHAARAGRGRSVRPRRSGSRRAAVRASAASAEGGAAAGARAAPGREAHAPPLACPICHEAFEAALVSNRAGAVSCQRCRRTFSRSANGTVDLTIAGSGAAGAYTEQAPTGQTLFQNPLVSFAYERGWRDSFSWAGFPGADAEFDTAQRFLEPARGGVLVDVSCGSGLFSRRFVKSGAYAHVVASDFSESMLEQARAFFDEDDALKAELAAPGGEARASFVRADVGRLPFATGSVDGIHAGAALHCWPSPQAALAEISRVLKPGGVFVASTFLDPVAPLGEVLGDDVTQPLSQLVQAQQVSRPYKWWSEPELRGLVQSVGLESFDRQRTRQFILLKASKPL